MKIPIVVKIAETMAQPIITLSSANSSLLLNNLPIADKSIHRITAEEIVTSCSKLTNINEK